MISVMVTAIGVRKEIFIKALESVVPSSSQVLDETKCVFFLKRYCRIQLLCNLQNSRDFYMVVSLNIIGSTDNNTG